MVAVHLKDTLAVTDKFGGKFKGVPFGEGCVNFPQRFRQMESLKFRGPYVIEMWHAEGTEDCAEIKKAKNWLTQQYFQAVQEGEP